MGLLQSVRPCRQGLLPPAFSRSRPATKLHAVDTGTQQQVPQQSNDLGVLCQILQLQPPIAPVFKHDLQLKKIVIFVTDRSLLLLLLMVRAGG